MTNCEKYTRIADRVGLGYQTSPAFTKARFVKDMIKRVLAGEVKTEDIETEVATYFTDHSFDLGLKNRFQIAELAQTCIKQIERYTNSEKRTPLYPEAKQIKIGKQYKFVKPDEMFITYEENGDKYITVARLKCTKPSFTEKAVLEGKAVALPLYELLNFGRTMITGKGTEHVVAAMYFLSTQADVSYIEPMTGNSVIAFAPDFFGSSYLEGCNAKAGSHCSGNNVLTLVETYRNGHRLNVKTSGSGRTYRVKTVDYDAIFKDAVEANYAPKPASECTEADCRTCPIKDMCKYEMPPTMLEIEKETAKAKRMRLTPAQKQASEFDSGIVRINAGAGTGKTNTVKSHFVSLCQKGVDPTKILVITFTNSGAEEMRSRIVAGLKRNSINVNPSALWIMTFNAFGDILIKENYDKLGYSAKPKLIDDIEKARIISDLLNSSDRIPGLDYAHFTTDTRYVKGAIAVTKAVFTLVKKYQLNSGSVEECKNMLFDKFGIRLTEETVAKLIDLFYEYDESLKSNNLIEFEDQLSLIFELIFQDVDFIEKLGFEHIIVDEFQDTDQQQIELLKHMVNTTCFKSLMVVGDDSQSIYSFRDTSPEFIINFEKYIGQHVEDISLLDNFRSSPQIIDFANKINDLNVMKISKELNATLPDNDPVTVAGFFDSKEEYRYIVNQIKQNIEDGVKPEDICFIGFSKTELLRMASLLSEENIPSVMMNPELLIENSRVLAGLAMLDALQNPADKKAILTYASAIADSNLVDATTPDLSIAVSSATEELNEIRTLPENAKRLRIIDSLKKINKKDDEVYNAFLATMEFKPSVRNIYEYADDFREFGERAAFRRNHSYPGVVLTTAHSSKGLEWPYAYVSLSNFNSSSANSIEEVRRLLFVSATRAKNRLVITGQWVAGKTEYVNEKGIKKKASVYNTYLVESVNAIGNDLTYDDVYLMEELYNAIKAENRKKEAVLRKSAKADVRAYIPSDFIPRRTRQLRKKGRPVVVRHRRTVLR